MMGNDEFIVYFVVKIIHFSLVSTHYKIIILHGLMRKIKYSHVDGKTRKSTAVGLK